MYDYNYDNGITNRNEFRADRRQYRAWRRAYRWGIYPEPNYTGQNQVSAREGFPSTGQVSYYNPASSQANYPSQQPLWQLQQQQTYRRTASLARQRALIASNAVSFIIFCSFLVLVWSMSGATYFWPGWIICLWVLGLISQASAYFVRRNIS